VNQSAGPHSVELLIEQNEAAVDRLLESVAKLSDEQFGEPSLLPDWSRGHVLTHLARNADGFRNLFTWAQTGVEMPMYPSAEARAADIEAGASRSGDELKADVSDAAKSLTSKARELPDEAWLTEVRMIRGPAAPTWSMLGRRLFEVEVHHADLGAGYRPADWPDWFVSGELYRVCGQLTANPDTPASVLSDAASGRQYFLRTEGESDLTITGPGYALLAWLIGRESDGDLSVDPDGPLPDIPSYG
jgi:maleylpyruvate isomerase